VFVVPFDSERNLFWVGLAVREDTAAGSLVPAIASSKVARVVEEQVAFWVYSIASKLGRIAKQ